MYLTYDDTLKAYLFVCSYYEKDTPKSLGFQWNPAKTQGRKVWFTTNIDTAMKALNYADGKTQSKLNKELGERKKSIKQSHAYTTSKVYKAPEGLKYYPFQNAGIEYMIKHPNTLLTDEMGCIGGDAIIIINRGKIGRRYSLKDLYLKFNHLDEEYYPNYRKQYSWDDSIPTLTKSLNNEGILGLNKIKKVIYRGTKDTIKIKTSGGKELVLTPDHEVLTETGWREIGSLCVGDSIKINGKPVCKVCGSDEKVITSSGAKFKGYCKKCMYRYKRSMPLRKEGRFIDGDGYVQVSGVYDHPRTANRKAKTIFYEHILVMEKYLGRFLEKDEVVHHLNGIKSDNRIENLKLTTIKEHRRKYHNNGFLNLQNDSDVWFIPKSEKIISIEQNGMIDVYDIVMSDPNRSFVANGIIVHNCGKSIQVIGLINNTDIKKVLVICPNIMKLTWQLEIWKWLCKKLSISVIYAQRYVESDIMIINYDILSRFEQELSSIKWDLVVADEAHYIKSAKTARYKSFSKILKNARRKVFLTGTPILNKPIELWNAIQELCPKEFGSYWQFGKEFCGAKQVRIGYDRENEEVKYAWDFSGASNLSLLQSKLRSSCMIRRLKKDVLKELPDLTRQVILLNDEEISDEEKELLEQAKDDYQAQVESLKVNSLGFFEVLSRIRHETALKKVPKIIEFVENILENEGKVVLFGHHKDVLGKFKEKWPDSVIITGDTPVDKRQEAIEQFQKDPKIRLFIGSIQASGVGITLTESSTVVFAELDWVPANISQAESRLLRIGQKNAVNSYHLVVNGTIDAHLAQTIVRKQEIMDSALDDPINFEEIIGVMDREDNSKFNLLELFN